MKGLYCGVRVLTSALLAANVAAQVPSNSAKTAVVPSALRLDYSTFLGGSGEDRAHGMAVDGQGNIYLTGPIQSNDFPTTADALNRASTGIYFAKLRPTGALLYSTYLGAAGGINYAHGVAVDKDGNVYIAGNTTNASFPTTPGAFQTAFKGPSDGHHGDAFVVKLSPAGNRIIYSTFLGGTGRDIGGQITVDANGNAYLLGSTSSSDFPVTPGAFQATFRGGESQPSGRGDLFVAKLSADGRKLVYGTYVGGSGTDIYGGNLIVDAAGGVMFGGTTTSPDFPTTANAIQKSYGGGSGIRAGGDAFFVKVNPTGTGLEYASYVGGRGDDNARSIAVNNDGMVWLAGDTTSDDFPTTPDAYSRQKQGGSDCFFLELNPRGGPLLYSSLLGGGKSDNFATIAVHPSGRLVLTGQTESADFPVTPGVDSTTLKGPTDLFIALFDAAGRSLGYSTFLGGSGGEVPGPLLLIKDGVYLAGNTTSTDFPVTPGAGDTTYNGGTNIWGGDAFVARFTLPGKDESPQASSDFDRCRSAPPSARSVPARGASFQGLGDLPGGTYDSMGLRVSADGSVVVGNGTAASGKQACRWTQREGMVSLGNLPNAGFKQSWAVAVSADGSVIVGYGDPDGSGRWDTHRGFRWTRADGMAAMAGLDGSTRHEALAVSADGAVIVGDGGAQAFRWTRGDGVAGLGVLPGRANSRAIGVSADGSVTIGSSYQLPSWDNEEAFLWTRAGGMQGLGFLPGGRRSFPNAVSADGTVVVGTGDSSAGSVPFRWTRGTGMVSLGDLPGRKVTHPGAVTANGAIVVGASFIDRRERATAFIWEAAHGMRSLQTVLELEYGLNLTGWHLQNASGITPDGSVIVGWGASPSGQTEAFRAVLNTGPGRVEGRMARDELAHRTREMKIR